MNEIKEARGLSAQSARPLILLESRLVKDQYSVNVPVNHEHLDTLVGRMMQMCDLIGDVEQRKALKDTIKRISRDWLDEQYEIAGYDKYRGSMPGTREVKVKSTDGTIVE